MICIDKPNRSACRQEKTDQTTSSEPMPEMHVFEVQKLFEEGATRGGEVSDEEGMVNPFPTQCLLKQIALASGISLPSFTCGVVTL